MKVAKQNIENEQSSKKVKTDFCYSDHMPSGVEPLFITGH